MARRPPPPKTSFPAEAPTAPERLIEAFDRLTEELSGIRTVLDNVREDLSYIIRNGISHQPIEHVLVNRMTLDSASAGWESVPELEVGSRVPGDPPHPDRFADLVESFQASVETIAQGQLEVILGVLDGVRREIVDTLNKHSKTAATVSPLVTSPLSAGGVSPDSAPLPPSKGRLF